MLRGLYTAYTGLKNEQNRLDIMTNNLANASTVGFKKEGSTSQAFNSVFSDKLKDASVGLSTVQRIGSHTPGVKIGENYTDYTQGSFRITDNVFDLALGGEGFFAIEFKNRAGEISTKYTRAGDFTLDKDGNMVTNEGDFLLDVNGKHIKINPLHETAIDENGYISQNGTRVAQIKVTDFEDYNYLEKYGETYFQPIEGAEDIASDAKINSGILEMSNVQVVTEMVNMIAITRQYESNQKIMQTYDSSLDITVNQLGKV